MRIVNESVLNLFRNKEVCEWCRRRTSSDQPLHPHHFRAKGMGGGRRLDHPWNLLALCFQCHNEVHNGQIPRCDLLAVIAAREKVNQEEIQAELDRLTNLPRACGRGCEKPCKKKSAPKCARK